MNNIPRFIVPSLKFLSLPPLLLFLHETLYLSLATMMQQSWCSTWIMHPGKLASHGWLPPGGLDFGLVCVCLFRCNSPCLWIGLDDSRFSCSSPVEFLSFLSIQCRQIKRWKMILCFILFTSSNTQFYESRIYCLYTFWVFSPDKSLRLI